MRYHQLTSEVRYALSALRRQGLSQAAIGRALGRHPSTIGRELQRNSRSDGGYLPFTADEMTRGRRKRSRRNWRFDEAAWALVRARLELHWSLEQVAGRLRREKLLRISHETIDRYVWYDKMQGGSLYLCLRGSRKRKWKRYRMTAAAVWAASARSRSAPPARRTGLASGTWKATQ